MFYYVSFHQINFTLLNSEMGTSISSKSSAIYIHEKSASMAVFKSLMELGERYQHSSPAAYLQCMLEGHLLLRIAMTVERQNNASPGTVSGLLTNKTYNLNISS